MPCRPVPFLLSALARSLASIIAVTQAVDAVSCMVPRHCSLKPVSWRSQSHTTSSSSVSAGQLSQEMPSVPSPELAMSPSTEASAALEGNQP